jgi:hypothetical protein
VSETKPPPTLPTGVSMPHTCHHGGNEETCPFCKADDELVTNPELAESKQRPHDFGCPLFINESWTDREHANYERIYGGTNCTCKEK